ncbi:nucleotidyltransferase family protein [Methanosarcina mazei]|nr:nucleotidyltransferase family protein [Methanosarcina mazei]
MIHILVSINSDFNRASSKTAWRIPETMPSQELKDAEYFMKILRQHLPELKEKYSVNYLGVFGSYIRGEQTEDSDLDILVQFDKKPGLFKYIELEDHLSELLGVKVDLVMKSALKPNIGKRILSEVEVV